MKRNELQIGGKVENLFVNMVFPKKKKLLKKHKFEKTTFHVCVLENGLTNFGLKFCKIKYYKTLKSPYLYQVQ